LLGLSTNLILNIFPILCIFLAAYIFENKILARFNRFENLKKQIKDNLMFYIFINSSHDIVFFIAL
jgi:hypothetical protein